MAHSRDEWTEIEAERKLKRMRRQLTGMAAHIQGLRHDLDHVRWGMPTRSGVTDPATLREDIVFWQGMMADLKREMARLHTNSTRSYYEAAQQARQQRAEARVQIRQLVAAIDSQG